MSKRCAIWAHACSFAPTNPKRYITNESSSLEIQKQKKLVPSDTCQAIYVVVVLPFETQKRYTRLKIGEKQQKNFLLLFPCCLSNPIIAFPEALLCTPFALGFHVKHMPRGIICFPFCSRSRKMENKYTRNTTQWKIWELRAALRTPSFLRNNNDSRHFLSTSKRPKQAKAAKRNRLKIRIWFILTKVTNISRPRWNKKITKVFATSKAEYFFRFQAADDRLINKTFFPFSKQSASTFSRPRFAQTCFCLPQERQSLLFEWRHFTMCLER